MKKTLSVLFIMMSLSVVMLANVIVETFTNPEQVNQHWLFFGSPQPEIGGPVYGKQSVFDNFGDGWCESGIYSKDWWDFSNGGSIEAVSLGTVLFATLFTTIALSINNKGEITSCFFA